MSSVERRRQDDLLELRLLTRGVEGVVMLKLEARRLLAGAWAQTRLVEHYAPSA